MDESPLANHIYELGDIEGHHTTDSFDMARGILADPQAHIDALVEAGVVTRIAATGTLGLRILYEVVSPHTHEWRVVSLYNPCDLSCECGARAQAPNRLPIEVPE